MRILGYIGTYNEGIEKPLRALLAQTRPLHEILVVDNASTEEVVRGPLPENVTVVRNSLNLGPSGAIRRGFQYAIERGHDWMWIFDADSAPRSDALQTLVELYESLDPSVRQEAGILSCSHLLLPSERILKGRRFASGGPRPAKARAGEVSYECDAVIWSGSLYRLEAVREIGMPRCGTSAYWEDLGHDYGDLEYSNRVRRSGRRIFVHQKSLVEQAVGDSREIRLLGMSVLSTNHPASRRYLYFRNLVYFWLHIFPEKDWPSLLFWFCYRLLATQAKILIAEKDRASKWRACFRGARDGLLKRMDGHY